jgi:streptogramin lyase
LIRARRDRTGILIKVLFISFLILTSFVGMNYVTRVNGQSAQPKYVTEYPVPTPNAAPLAITVDGEGNVWFTESNASKLAMFNPTNQSFREYKVPWIGDMWGVIADKKGSIWFTLSSARGSVSPGGAIVPGGFGSIVQFNPSTGNFTHIQIPSISCFPLRLREDNQGRIWFTELLGSRIGVYDPNLNSLKEYPVPTNESGPADLTFDPQGNLWFTEAYASQVGEFNPLTQTFVEYPIGGNATYQSISSPVGIALDSQGIVWVADHGGNWIVRFDPQTRTTTKFPTHFPPKDVYPISLVNDLLIDSSGRIWFAEHGGNSIGYFVPETQQMVEFPIPTGPISATLWLALAPSGVVWFAEWSGNNIGMVPANVQSPITVSASTNSLNVNQGDQASITLQVVGAPGFVGNSTAFLALDSYNPEDVTGVFTPPNFTIGEVPTSVQVQLTIAKNAEPGKYTLAIGVDIGSMRALTMVSLAITKAGILSTTMGQSVEIMLVAVVAAVVIGLVLRRSLRRPRAT